jgi:LPXTG-motif cell wall-anchored protein
VSIYIRKSIINLIIMKKSVLVFSLNALLFLGGMNQANAQEQPKPKKDTINMDTDAKPTFYYAADEEKSKTNGGDSKILIIAGTVVLAGVGGFFLVKKNKK